MNTFLDRARQEGYSDDEIIQEIERNDPKYSQFVQKSRQEGYSPQDITNFLSKEEPSIQNPDEQSSVFGKFKEVADYALRPVGEWALGAIEATPKVFGLEIAGRAASALHGSESMQRVGFKQAAVGEIEDLLQQKSAGAWSPEKEQRLEKFYELAQMPEEEMKEQGAFFVPPKIAPSTIIEAIPGQEPRNAVERAARLMGMMFSNKTLGAVSASEQVPKIIKEVVRTGPISTAAVALKDIWGVPEFATLAVGGLGKILFDQGKNLASWFSKKYLLGDAKNLKLGSLPSTFQKEVEGGMQYADKALKDGLISKDQYEAVRPFIEEAEKYGIALPYSAVTNSTYFKQVERIITKRDLSQQAITQLRQNAAKQFRESMEIALEDMKKSAIYQEVGGVADALAETVTKTKHAGLKKQYTKEYDFAEKGLEKSQPISAEGIAEIEDSLNRVYDKTTGSFIQTTPEAAAANLASTTKQRLTVSPTAKGKPELQNLTFPTGKEEAQKIITEQQNVLQQARDKVESTRKAAETATQKLKDLRRKKGKREAKREEEQKFQEEINAYKEAKRKLSDAEEAVKNSRKMQEKTLSESQKDLEIIFGDEAKNMRIDEFGRIRFISGGNGSNLTKSLRSLNNIMDYEHPGVVNLFSDTKQTMQNVLEREYGITHAKELAAQKRANELFGKTQELFGESAKWKKWGIKQDVLPEDLLSTISTVDRMKAFEKDFPEAQELMGYLKRLKVEEMLRPIFNQRKYDPGLFADGLNKLEQNPLFNYLVPQKTMNNLKGLQKLDAHLERTSSRFYKENPTPAETSYVTTFKNLVDPRYWVLQLGNRVSKDRLADTFSKVLLDPNITTRMRKIGEEAAAAVGNAEKMARAEAKMDLFWEEMVAIAESSTTAGASAGF